MKSSRPVVDCYTPELNFLFRKGRRTDSRCGVLENHSLGLVDLDGLVYGACRVSTFHGVKLLGLEKRKLGGEALAGEVGGGEKSDGGITELDQTKYLFSFPIRPEYE